jgi:pimeloyl-ACP methyl ester carboxylesterase
MAGYAAELLPKMVAPRTIEARPEVAQHVLTMMRNAPAEGAAAALRGRALRQDYVGLLGRIDVPTLVLVGSEDEYTPVEWATRTAGRIPGAELVVIDGAGHLPNLERPDEFDLALAEFLKPVSHGVDAR